MVSKAYSPHVHILYTCEYVFSSIRVVVVVVVVVVYVYVCEYVISACSLNNNYSPFFYSYLFLFFGPLVFFAHKLCIACLNCDPGIFFL